MARATRQPVNSVRRRRVSNGKRDPAGHASRSPAPAPFPYTGPAATRPRSRESRRAASPAPGSSVQRAGARRAGNRGGGAEADEVRGSKRGEGRGAAPEAGESGRGGALRRYPGDGGPPARRRTCAQQLPPSRAGDCRRGRRRGKRTAKPGTGGGRSSRGALLSPARVPSRAYPPKNVLVPFAHNAEYEFARISTSAALRRTSPHIPQGWERGTSSAAR
jgi:hypothetical protein